MGALKLKAAEAKAFTAKPDLSLGAILVYGPDPLLVSYGRDMILQNLLARETDTGHERIATDQLRRIPDALLTMIKAQGFFAGRQVISVEAANDLACEATKRALDGRADDDGWLLLSAGQLRPKSKLRKLFESHKRAMAVPIYDLSFSPREVRELLDKAHLKKIDADAMKDLETLGRNLAPQMFLQTVEKLRLYKRDQENDRVQTSDIEACTAREDDRSLDDLIADLVAQRTRRISPALRQVYARGQNPVALLIRAQREFRAIFSAASHPEGPISGVATLRPPVFGPRREQMIRHVSKWGVIGAGGALRNLLSVDRIVRSEAKVPAQAAVERAFLRISMTRIKR